MTYRTNENILFTEKDYRHTFQGTPVVRENLEHLPPADASRITHQIETDGGIRWAEVKKTVAYIAVDESEGAFVWEKWHIRHLWY